MIDTDNPRHDGTILAAWTGEARAACDCLWRGPWRTTREAATADLARHYRQVAES